MFGTRGVLDIIFFLYLGIVAYTRQDTMRLVSRSNHELIKNLGQNPMYVYSVPVVLRGLIPRKIRVA